MKTLYELLEVSETASNEMIEKAYKFLAKKYHPDLQPEESKAKAEEKMKQINEAYDILSNEIKRKEYDQKLKQQREAEQQEKQNVDEQANNFSQSYYKPNTSAYNRQEQYERPQNYNNQEIKKQQKMAQDIQKKYEEQYQRQCQNAYENYLRSLGYKIKYKWTWENYKAMLLTIAIIIAIGAILWIFPPTHKIIIEFYETNVIFRTIINIIGGILVGIWNAISSIFTKK